MGREKEGITYIHRLGEGEGGEYIHTYIDLGRAEVESNGYCHAIVGGGGGRLIVVGPNSFGEFSEATTTLITSYNSYNNCKYYLEE